MLNIRINFSVDVRKVAAAGISLILLFSHLIMPQAAMALPAPTVAEKPVHVSLTYLNVTTTMSQAKKDLASSGSKYFDAEALAFLTTYTSGWKMSEWKCLRQLWQHESHFNPKARNMHSGAYGIAQFMPTTWGNYKVTKTSSAQLQIQYGLRYIEKRYGSACGAWTFWQKHSWY